MITGVGVDGLVRRVLNEKLGAMSGSWTISNKHLKMRIDGADNLAIDILAKLVDEPQVHEADVLRITENELQLANGNTLTRVRDQ